MDRARLFSSLVALRGELAALDRTGPAASLAGPIDRAILELDALRFHLEPPPAKPVVVLLGGTGTGKSTLSNRLLGASEPITASSFRRTFTAGPVAIVAASADLPAGWLGLTHQGATTLPARGETDRLIVAQPPTHGALLDAIALVDTPDVDGDVPAHHALADRAFRWANRVVFLVSPEKYQMTELLPYFRLAERWGVQAAFAMNKAEDAGPVEDFAQQLKSMLGHAVEVYVVPRDDATYQPDRDRSLDALRTAIAKPATMGEAGLSRRAADVAGRTNDQVVEPLRTLRQQADRAVAALRELRSNESGVNVDPMTRQLRKRMQQRSVLYLMGPQRMLERLKNAPAMLARLPRSTFDLFRGKATAPAAPPEAKEPLETLPDFRTIAIDQFRVVQARVGDILRDNGGPLIDAEAAWRIDPDTAGRIVDEELDALRGFLEARWNAHPRDTALVLKLVKRLPGGERLTQLSESAPYLVVIACGLQHFAFHGVDLLVIGGFSLATWLGEKISDEVGQRTRQANANIDQRFDELVRRQIGAALSWLDARLPDVRRLDALGGQLDDLMEAAQAN